MTAKNEIKHFSDHFRVFSIYLKIDYDQCREEMKDFFQNSSSKNPINLRKKIDGWWSSDTNVQSADRAQIKVFFKDMADQRDFEWKNDWLNKKPEELEQDKDLRSAARKYNQPYAMARFFGDYVESNPNPLHYTIDNYCHKYFYVYYVHTGGYLVRDVLKFHGHRGDNIFCNFFQYTKHVMKSKKYPEWKHIERWHGNVFFNLFTLNISFITPEFSAEQGPKYNQLLFHRLLEDDENLGLLLAVTDTTAARPVALPVLVQRTEIEDIKAKDMPNHVGKFPTKKLSDSQEAERIKWELGTNKIIINQSVEDTGITAPNNKILSFKK